MQGGPCEQFRPTARPQQVEVVFEPVQARQWVTGFLGLLARRPGTWPQRPGAGLWASEQTVHESEAPVLPTPPHSTPACSYSSFRLGLNRLFPELCWTSSSGWAPPPSHLLPEQHHASISLPCDSPWEGRGQLCPLPCPCRWAQDGSAQGQMALPGPAQARQQPPLPDS